MIRQKQIQHQTYPDLTALSASGLNTPEYAFITSENAFYTRIGGVNTKISVATNLSIANRTISTIDILSDTGTDITLPTATTTLSGVLSGTDKSTYDATSTLTGITAGVSNLGTFTGTVIPDSSTIKAALQSLETRTELSALDSNVVHLSGAETISGAKTFSTQPIGITATSIVNTPSGSIAATTVQAAITELDTEKQNISEKGVANGYAGLDATGKVPASQLPSYVDDVLEFTTQAGFPATGETGKLYTVTTGVDISKIYRWTGSVYVEVSAAAGAAVSSVFTRTGAIVAVAGDYTATQITNVAAGNIASTTVQAAINELDTEKQAKLQIQDEGVNVGALGAVSTINFVGTNVVTTVVGSTATVTVSKGFTEQVIKLTPTGTNVIPNLSPLPADSTKVQIFVNSALAENSGITVSAGGVFTVTAGTLGYSIDTSDIITCYYLS